MGGKLNVPEESWAPPFLWHQLSATLGLAVTSLPVQSVEWAFDSCGFISPFLQASICKMQIHRGFVMLNYINVCKALLLLSAEEPERHLMILHSSESLDCLY